MAVTRGDRLPGGRRPDQDYDPPGPLVAPGGRAGIFRGRLVVIGGSGPPGSGLFVYSPSPAAGNLIASIAATAGNDPYGNAVIGGSVAVYQPSTGTAVAMQNNALQFFKGPVGGGGPWTGNGSIAAGTTGILNLNAAAAAVVSATQLGIANGLFTPATATELEVQGTAALKNATAPAAVVGYTEPFSNSGNLLFVNGLTGDGNTYDTGIKHVDLPSTSIVAVNPAFTAIGVAVPVGIGKYKVHVQGRYTGAAAAVPRFGFTTPTTSAADGDAMFMSNAAANTCQGSITTTWTGPTMNATVLVLNGWAEFTFTAAGTLQFGGNTSIGADTFTWTTGTMEIWPVN